MNAWQRAHLGIITNIFWQCWESSSYQRSEAFFGIHQDARCVSCWPGVPSWWGWHHSTLVSNWEGIRTVIRPDLRYKIHRILDSEPRPGLGSDLWSDDDTGDHSWVAGRGDAASPPVRLSPPGFPGPARPGPGQAGQQAQGQAAAEAQAKGPRGEPQHIQPFVTFTLDSFQSNAFSAFCCQSADPTHGIVSHFRFSLSFLTFHFSLSISHVWFHTWSVVSVSLKTVIQATWTLIANLSKYQGWDGLPILSFAIVDAIVCWSLKLVKLCHNSFPCEPTREILILFF